ncbi:hypothetical protein [Paenibacillus eucommiae]|uniref:Uncharacterized protein n=1 Tax=Paenibacillus eucommiae TaxID=1355755 RepID=A0ABS4J7Y1_9BACL|nr:hypothetical protein [Paenibacillus eucommiae]MBP1995961.1 hypothetical protein [Paenibacillus eucommiae]
MSNSCSNGTRKSIEIEATTNRVDVYTVSLESISQFVTRTLPVIERKEVKCWLSQSGGTTHAEPSKYSGIHLVPWLT